MAKYDATKFYWLQLKEDFFDEDAIDWLEEQPNGKEYSLFYLKLCLKSLRTNGVLIRRVGNMLVPYDHVKLGELTRTNSDTVLIAMNLLKQIGLVHVLENGELYLTQVENMIGSQSKGAFKKAQQRLTGATNNIAKIEGGQMSADCPPKIDIEKEIELEKELKKDNTAVNGEVVDETEIMFNQFWSAYPKKVNKKGCYKAFKNIKNLKQVFNSIIESVEYFKNSKGWQKDNGQYIPYPTTFINQERWNDKQEETREDKLNAIDMGGWV